MACSRGDGVAQSAYRPVDLCRPMSLLAFLSTNIPRDRSKTSLDLAFYDVQCYTIYSGIRLIVYTGLKLAVKKLDKKLYR